MSDKYKPVIGMEIHAELKTKRKMFCGCLNNSDEIEPNKNICPVCLAHPGVLPVANRRAIEKIIKVGLALGSEIPERAVFSRKNYFYPDLPKGYQITSQPDPFAVGGFIEINGKKLKIDHIHLEEDTGTLSHSDEGTLVDFNRAGVPLMELVTEPCVESGGEARKFCEELQLILRYLEASEANMEKGEMRCEVNISLKNKDGSLGTKVEIKNLNSFRVIERAVEYEIKRQAEIIEKGEKVVQETRGWDDEKQETFSQRKKEEAHDYRYFPEPDLPEFRTADFGVEELKNSILELPKEKRERFKKEYELNEEQIEILILDKEMAEFFEQTVSELPLEDKNVKIKTLYNYLVSDLRGLMISKGIGFLELKVIAENFVDLVVMAESGEIGSRVAKDVLAKMFENGGDPRTIVKEEGLEQVSDEGELKEIVLKIIRENEKVAEDYKSGKEAALKFLIGQAMRETKGKGNPEVLKKMLKENI